MIKVVTHDGKFHPDEIFACVLLEWFKFDRLSFIRTRNETSLKRYRESKHHYVIDVGGEYDPSKNNFDHHQASFTDVSETGDHYSSCGLIWKEMKNNEDFRKVNYLSDFIIEKISEFVRAVDRHDNGVEFFNEVEFVSMYNYANYNQMTRFKKAFKAADEYFYNKLRLWRYLDQIDSLEDEALAEAKDGIILSKHKLSVSEKLNKSDNYLLVCERAENEYSITSLNLTDQVDFSVRCPAPKEWAGLSGKEIKEFDKSLVFSHKNQFLTIVHGTEEDAKRIAQLIVNRHLDERRKQGLEFVEQLKNKHGV